MTTLESLIHLAGNLASQEYKTVRRYVASFISPCNPRTNKGLQLFDLAYKAAGQKWSAAQLEKQLYGRPHPTAFPRLVSQLRKRVLEGISLPIATAKGNYSERIKAQFHFHRQYLKALALFEAGDYESADETLLSLISWTTNFELYAERIEASEFLIHTVRMYGNLEVIKHFRGIPGRSRQAMAIIATGEDIRELMNKGELKDVTHQYGQLKAFAKESNSYRTLFVLTGVEGRVAELRGDYEMAEKFFVDQLSYCNQQAVRSEENRAKVYVDLARVRIHLKKFAVAREFLDMAARCRKKFKTTAAELERLKKELPKEE